MKPRKRDGKEHQFDLKGEYELDERRQVRKRLATIEHLEEALAFAKRQADAGFLFTTQLELELEVLRPHWTPGMTKGQAVEAFLVTRSAKHLSVVPIEKAVESFVKRATTVEQLGELVSELRMLTKRYELKLKGMTG